MTIDWTKPVETVEEGLEVTIHTTKAIKEGLPVLGEIQYLDGYINIGRWSLDGSYDGGPEPCHLDLRNKPEKRVRKACAPREYEQAKKMKIEIEEYERVTLEDFADEHGLIMLVKELPVSQEFYEAKFKDTFAIELSGYPKKLTLNIEGINYDILSITGNGASINEAILDYADKIQTKSLFVETISKKIQVPKFIKAGNK